MAGVSYIGKAISLVSHSDIRYRGILHSIDPAASTISLSNVMSMGTEHRRPAESYIPPSDLPYDFIIFRASEVKDIAVDQTPAQPPPPQRNVHDDPAVMTASAPPPAREPLKPQTYPEQSAPQAASADTAHVSPTPASAPVPTDTQQQKPLATSTGSTSRQANGAATGMENVQRAMGELRVSNGTQGSRRGGRAGGSSTIRAGEINIPAAEFDFAKSNARFDKTALATHHDDSDDGEITNPSDDENKSPVKEKSPVLSDKAYNPKASFFDTLTSGSSRPAPGEKDQQAGRGGYSGRGRRGASRREEERQRNVATFGEPGGGPGLMGPGAYIAGWGGTRRGQGRGGRRAPRPS